MSRTLINLFDYEAAAGERIERSFLGYYSGGAGDEITLRENRDAWNRVALRPRMLRDVSRRSSTTTVQGRETAMPVVIAPTAMARLAHPDGEVAIARAAKAVGIVQCISTIATASVEEVTEAGAANWFQLYIYKDRSVTERLVARAVASGVDAIVLTVDVPVMGVRENIMRSGLTLPAGLSMRNFDDVHESDAAGVMAYVESQFDPGLTWSDVDWLRSLTSLPVLVKGVLRADDAKLAVDRGVSGVIVSNHGGRQLDTAVTGIDALPEVVRAVGGQVEVYVDGGVRRGTDVIKAIAMGARAVLVGRPLLWGLAVGGQQGVEDVLAILHRELDNAMAQCGCSTVDEIDAGLIYGQD